MMKLFCECPHCGAIDSLNVTEYRVYVANTPLILVFDPADKQQTIVPVFDRNSGEPLCIHCCCMVCRSEMLLNEVLRHNERDK